tara:strand:- start:537 stop:827 length:291 start_codon:yes stop_codon:yes gene_type:complete
MKKRFLEILKCKKLSSSQFADKINVSNSAVSHIINGRNKPSLEIIQNILIKFPDINPRWLILGEGEIFSVDQYYNKDKRISKVIVYFDDKYQEFNS